MNLNDLTVIIPTKNEEKNIRTFLASLPADVKLIVVDCSTDNTRAIINQLRPENTTVIFAEGNIPFARQLGADKCKTEWILYSDADMVFCPTYFSALQKIKTHDKLGEIIGPKLSKDKYKFFYYFYSTSMLLLSWITIPNGSGSNMILRKSALKKVGGFDSALAHSEDSDILWRIRKAGYRFKFRFSLKVYEMDHRRLEKGVFKKFWHGLLRYFYLMTGINKDKVRQSDWGYWD